MAEGGGRWDVGERVDEVAGIGWGGRRVGGVEGEVAVSRQDVARRRWGGGTWEVGVSGKERGGTWEVGGVGRR